MFICIYMFINLTLTHMRKLCCYCFANTVNVDRYSKEFTWSMSISEDYVTVNFNMFFMFVIWLEPVAFAFMLLAYDIIQSGVQTRCEIY